jgi:Tfp pilus assembly PilM family ATPase
VRHPGPVTALDVDGQVLRIAQVAPRASRSVVSRIVVERLELGTEADRSDPQVLGKAMAKALERARVKPGPVIMGIPHAWVVSRTLSLPVVNDIRQLTSMVHFQVGKDLPFRLEDAVVDFKIRKRLNAPTAPAINPPDKESPNKDREETPAEPPKFEVLVAAVKRDTVAFYQKVAMAAGVKLTGLAWLSMANARLVDACQVAQGDEAVALVSLRPDEVSIDIVARQSLLFSRGASLKAHPPAVAEPDTTGGPTSTTDNPTSRVEGVPTPTAEAPPTLAEAAAIEVIRSLHGYGGMEAQNPVLKIIVAGATGHETAVVETLQKRLNLPCSLLNPASVLDLPKPARELATGCLSVIGLGLSAGDAQGLPFDFLNPKRPAVQRNMRRIRLMAAGAILAVFLFSLLAARTYLVKRRMEINRTLQAELTEAEKKRPIYRQMRRQLLTLQEWAKGEQNWLEHYAYLSAILPPSEEVYVTSLQVSGQGALRLALQARSGEVLAKLDKQLRTAGYDIKPFAITPGADKNGYTFRSSVDLLASEKLKIDLGKVKAPPRLEDDGSLEGRVRKVTPPPATPARKEPAPPDAPARRGTGRRGGPS